MIAEPQYKKNFENLSGGSKVVGILISEILPKIDEILKFLSTGAKIFRFFDFSASITPKSNFLLIESLPMEIARPMKDLFN